MNPNERLIAFCPEISKLNYAFRFSALDEVWMAALIAAALIRRIKERGEWFAFNGFAWEGFAKTNTSRAAYTAWLTTPETLIHVAEEWVGREG